MLQKNQGHAHPMPNTVRVPGKTQALHLYPLLGEWNVSNTVDGYQAKLSILTPTFLNRTRMCQKPLPNKAGQNVS